MKKSLSNPTDLTISLKEVCEILSISSATVKNWLRLGKLQSLDNGKNFSRKYIENLCKKIKLGQDMPLKSRRNKKKKMGKVLYNDYINNKYNQEIIAKILLEKDSITEEELRIILANFALQLYYQSYSIKEHQTLQEFLSSTSHDDVFYSLIMDLLGSYYNKKLLSSQLNYCFDYSVLFDPMEDTLGYIYISLRDLNHRKASGTYYTPITVVNSLIESICDNVDYSEYTFFDPCCGSGNFLIGLVNKGIPIRYIYGQDIDEISVQIARINLFLLCHQVSKEELYSKLVCSNTLENLTSTKYDIILGNPPWGYEFSKEEIQKMLFCYKTAKKTGTESFDLFIEKSLSMLKKNGILAFVLPESILSVTTHFEARRLLIEKCSFKFVSYLGNVFSNVQCPAIILGVELNNHMGTIGCKVEWNKTKFIINQRRKFSNGNLNFNASDEENECLDKIESIPNRVYLKNNALFALGLVTGNNKKYISNKKKKGYETVLKGSSIYRYHIGPSTYYIDFDSNQFQQVAPIEVYRAPEKLLYRFISEVPVFAYDHQQTLSLNSCNILIPQIKGLEIKYILAILNSSVSAYYISKKFNSVKLLRSHIEQLPIPIISLKKQKQIIELVDHIMKTPENVKDKYKELDCQIMALYDLTMHDQKIIENALSKKNLFLIDQ